MASRSRPAIPIYDGRKFCSVVQACMPCNRVRPKNSWSVAIAAEVAIASAVVAFAIHVVAKIAGHIRYPTTAPLPTQAARLGTELASWRDIQAGEKSINYSID